MRKESLPSIIAPQQRARWKNDRDGIWTLDGAFLDAIPTRSILTTLWDQPRWLEAYHLYDQRGSELFEQICELPEYYLTRTENSILEAEAATIIAAAPVECIVELGAGYSKKTIHLLTEQLRQRHKGIFAPIDVSRSGLLASRDALKRDFPRLEFHGLHARYEEGFTSIDQAVPTLFVFLGSTIGNFNHSELPRFFKNFSQAMGPDDYLLLGADRLKDVAVLEKAYDDSQGLTAQFILNVFIHINRLLDSNFNTEKMRYHAQFNSEWQQIEMYAVAAETHEVHFPNVETSFNWKRDERILVEISRKFDSLRLQEQLRFFDLTPVDHFTDPDEWFSVLLFKKQC
ncbi:MAG: L-histidine N(alpha)-methyltransferase [Deltaproteobacteria bacterium]|nr:L-histidine N(alpha)-methyltransferase [Deltaproteobacteria bacterium]